MSENPSSERTQVRRWVETWKRAGIELERIRERELASVDTREAIRQIFGSSDWKRLSGPPRNSSGLVEQQAWFAKLRR